MGSTGMWGRRPRRARVGAALLAVGLGLLPAACGSDGGSGGGGGAGGATPAAGSTATLPPGTKAAGAPVKIGFITAEGGSAVSLPEVREGAQAATAYANDYLGGIGGRPIQLVVCKSQEDAASARTCANEMVEQKVTAVNIGTTAFADSMVPVITGARIPYTTGVAASGTEFVTDGAFSWTGGFPATLGVMAQTAKDKGYKSVSLFVTDAPAVTAGANALGKPVFAKAGVGLDIVPIPLGTPDATSQVTAAIGKKPGAVILVGEGTFCSTVLKGLVAVNATQPKFVIQPCLSKTVEDAAPGALDGATLFTPGDTESDNAESRLYRTVMGRYAPKTALDGYAVTGYQNLLGLVRALKGLTGDVTPASVTSTLKAAKDVVLPAGDGLTFTCDGTAVPSLKALCSTGSVVATVKGTKATDYRTADSASLFGD
ncbi:amino acid/amide ABC transporter substrate-binding protein, HAAT family [Frankia torreyi]|uniref:Amino acid/amide ABC transporter substrate-binding protein, HAAT family n=2 Tax=Frankia TaxID=1854 RepID=A0A0D8BEF7_9ACTN|nr:amino acid/amide ABC transporter substrate-binding protein, HAAT family [Frankia torreyi]